MPTVPTLPPKAAGPQTIASPVHTSAIPQAFYDPASFASPRKLRRSLGARVGLAAIGVAVVAGIGLIGYAAAVLLEDPELPAVTAEPNYRSSVYSEVNAGGTESYSLQIRTDTVDGVIQVDSSNAQYLDWIGDDTQWFAQNDAGEWERFENSSHDDFVYDRIMTIADGLTIDEVVPPSSRPFMDVLSTDDVTMRGDDVTRFDLAIDISKMSREDPAAAAAFNGFWSDEAGSDVARSDGAPSSAPIGVTVWVTDDGIVHQVESKSDYDGSSFRISMIDTSTVKAFEPEFPPIPVDG